MTAAELNALYAEAKAIVIPARAERAAAARRDYEQDMIDAWRAHEPEAER